MYWTLRVCARKAGMAEARNVSPSPRPMISGHSRRGAAREARPAAGRAAEAEKARLVERHRDEREVALQLGVGGAHGVGQRGGWGRGQMVGDEVRDDLGVGLR